MAKTRADVLLVEKGLIDSREKAKRLIMEGKVFIGTERVEKPGTQLKDDVKIYIKGLEDTFVSRGGYKLEKMIDDYEIDLKNSVCVDIGASTGGFTHCMLKHGAKKVYAIDVGYNQLDYKLRMDDRVVSLERTNIRYFDTELISEEVDFISIDVSFISLELVLPIAKEICGEKGEIVALIKPQFEAGKGKVGKGGIVKDKRVHIEVIEKIIELAKKLNLNILALTNSPIKGTSGNIEFLIYLSNSDKNNENFDASEIVNNAYKNLND
ncbi:TlyA family RNA methyltransferase [Peptoniphilus sp. AGMB00490]|uniref:TlyA family RNA methyltransferase n=1 Tax=Peptoniphilus faecalis TaxID=2731255 RepID=A0A848RD60_9FIRM|nr:TlyA family RNA methyltransferase [Peptoniphilus faecalis]NMW84770.1 TlyA family RNA methyltransferase [Peptoniphilus faecalis]